MQGEREFHKALFSKWLLATQRADPLAVVLVFPPFPLVNVCVPDCASPGNFHQSKSFPSGVLSFHIKMSYEIWHFVSITLLVICMKSITQHCSLDTTVSSLCFVHSALNAANNRNPGTPFQSTCFEMHFPIYLIIFQFYLYVQQNRCKKKHPSIFCTADVLLKTPARQG